MKARGRGIGIVCGLAGLVVVLAAGGGTAPAAPEGRGAPAPGVNLAVAAEASASYVSGDTTLEALNDGYEPASSRDRSHRSYGNWPRRGTQWVQYAWSWPIHTNRIDVYWWDDRRGVRLPKACRLLSWDGERFVPVGHPSGLGVAGDRFNTTAFDAVRTTKLRLEIDASGNFSSGILEWRVYDAGGSPDFPPVVRAGVDRVVVLGGKTYLDGSAKTSPKGGTPTFAWRKASGPGAVAFADAGALSTTATFSKAGGYVLELTATRGPLRSSSTLAAKVIPPPREPALSPVGVRRYRVTSPLWKDRLKAVIVNWIPHCIAKISDPELPQGGMNNLIDAADKLAGKPHGRHRGYVFSNAWVFNTIEAICYALMVDPGGDGEIARAQGAMRATLEDWIPKVLAAQEPDGYLQTVFTLNDWEHWSPARRGAHEGYVAGYFLEAGIAHYLATGGKDTRLYRAAKRLADCWYAHIGPPPKKPWYDGHQGMELALVHFGRAVDAFEGGGAGRKYIELAKFLLDCRGGGHAYDQSHVPVVRQYEAVGHAVRASYSYTAMAQVAREVRDRDYLSAVMSLWDNIVNRKVYVTGGIGSGETSEGFGPDYSLRHNGYCESCSSCGLIFFQHELHLLWRDARYADLYEETLYNALLGSLDLEGKNFFYQNPLDCGRPRYPWHGCPCCVGNIPRMFLMLPTWIYSKGDDGIYVNLFVGSAVKVGDVAGTDVELVQATDYPWSGEVAITVHPAEAKAFRIRIRVPNRTVSALYDGTPPSDGIASIAVNGARVSPPVRNGYAVIERTWRAGDRIDLSLPMKVQRIRGIDAIEATRGQVALRRGPLIYTFESVDQDLDKALSPASPLTAEWRGDLLGGVVAIRGAWSDGSPLLAIPYYVRANRLPPASGSGGPGRGRTAVRSTVWVREAGGEAAGGR